MKIVLFCICLFFSFITVAQTGGRGDNAFNKGNYYGALKSYNKELEKASNTGEKNKIKARIANCLFRLNDVVKAGQIYNSLPQDVFGVDDYLFYAITCQRSGEYDKALELVQVVEDMGGDATAVQLLRASCQFAKESLKVKPLFSASKTNIDFNGFSSGVTYYKGKGLILAAPSTEANSATDSRGYRFTRLYQVVFAGDNGRMIPFADGVLDKYHIGAVTFTSDYKRMYYTRTILKKDGTSILKLMTARENNGKWEDAEELSVNSDDYSCAHPALFRDSVLFFVSDMPNGMGGKDIYMTAVNGAACGELQNLGSNVNTPGDELFPFIDRDGRLYFASNGHVGFGGLDVFVSRPDDKGGWSDPINMGRPVNSSMDDFGLVFKDTECKEGYISTNRGGTGAKDFLFAVKLLPAPGVPEVPGNTAPRLPRLPMIAGASDNNNSGQPGDAASVMASTAAQLEAQRRADAPATLPEKELFNVDYRYTIQVGAFRNPVPRVYFETFQNVKVYLGYDNIYRYTVGEYPEEGIALRDLAQVSVVVPDAFVADVNKYVAQKKIQNDVRGDKISDDELLLRRLKHFEDTKKARQRINVKPRYLNKPREEEVAGAAFDGYTVMLKVTEKVLSPADFAGIERIMVFRDGDDRYIYCMGFYNTSGDASKELNRARKMGYTTAAVLETNNYKYVNTMNTIQSSFRKSDPNSSKDLKDLLSL